jgi:hypothetical protein
MKRDPEQALFDGLTGPNMRQVSGCVARFANVPVDPLAPAPRRGRMEG